MTLERVTGGWGDANVDPAETARILHRSEPERHADHAFDMMAATATTGFDAIRESLEWAASVGFVPPRNVANLPAVVRSWLETIEEEQYRRRRR